MLVGREGELAALRALLAQGRVVTVTGVGGVGKTALALAAAPGAPVCELAPVARPGDVPAAVTGALGFPSLDAAVVGLADTRRLLVVDNCEHVLDAAAAVVERLVAGCPALAVLATSREALDVRGERVLPLAPLPLPDGDDPARLAASPAAALLLALAREAGVEIVLDQEVAAVVAALCRRLDGLPLAIELAAARTRSLTPAEILAHLSDRLDLLTRPRLRGPGRHRSLDAAIAWSHERLPAPTRRFFDRLGVFAGRFTAEMAHAVAGEPGADLLQAVDHLDQLVAQSLLTVRAQGGRSWYGLLDTLRTFARAQLAEHGELVAARDRWVDSMLELATDSRHDPDAASPGLWPTVHAAQADLREAVHHCVERDERPDRAVALLRPLWMTVHSGPAEPVTALGTAVLARWPDPSSPDTAAAAAVTAFAHLARDEPEEAARLAREALRAVTDPFAAWLARRTLVVCELGADRAEQALRWADEAVAGAAADLPSAANEVAALRAVVLAALGRHEAAARQARAAEDGATALGSATLQLWAGLISGCLLALHDPAAARVTLEALVRRCPDAAYPFGEGAAARALGAIALRRGEHAVAAGWLDRALDLFVRIGHTSHVRVTLRWVAGLALAAGRPAAEPLSRAAGATRTPISDVLERGWLDPLLRGAAGGASMPLHEAVELARRELTELAEPAPGRSDAAPDEHGLARFVLEGAVRAVTFAGRTVRLPDSKGMRDLAALLARPELEVHCTELAGAAVEQPDTGEVLDAEARRRYEARVVELQGELTEAEDLGDRGRAEKASLELDVLVDQLAAARGLGGRARRTGGTSERARTAVTWRVRAAIRRLDEVHPALGRHLHAAVKTGTWCCYRPEHPVDWQVTPDVGATA